MQKMMQRMNLDNKKRDASDSEEWSDQESQGEMDVDIKPTKVIKKKTKVRGRQFYQE